MWNLAKKAAAKKVGHNKESQCIKFSRFTEKAKGDYCTAVISAALLTIW